MLLKILRLKETPPYGHPSVDPGARVMPESLEGIDIVGPALQAWVIAKIKCVGLLGVVCGVVGLTGLGGWQVRQLIHQSID
jgi:hypothetical protein